MVVGPTGHLSDLVVHAMQGQMEFERRPELVPYRRPATAGLNFTAITIYAQDARKLASFTIS